ncbi:MAG: RHS repeat protein [Proteobacteria bacterium]|nr:RHS repeat protein [Pseudomonadota bacterium]
MYTANDLPETVKNARGYVSKIEYDGLDRRSKQDYAQPAVTGSASTTDYEQYGYDPDGNLTSLRRRSGQSITLGYDDLDRLTSRTYPTAADNATFGYDLLGQRLSANLTGHAVSYAWDNAGRLSSTTAGGRTLGYLYDAASNRVRTTWPDTGFYVTTGYDALNRPTQVKELGTTTLADYSSYDDLSRQVSVSRGNATATSYSYSNQGALATLAINLAGTAQDEAHRPQIHSLRRGGSSQHSGASERTIWLDTDKHSRTARWPGCCRRRARRWKWCRVRSASAPIPWSAGAARRWRSPCSSAPGPRRRGWRP